MVFLAIRQHSGDDDEQIVKYQQLGKQHLLQQAIGIGIFCKLTAFVALFGDVNVVPSR